MLGFLNKLLDANGKEIKRLEVIVTKINSFEPEFKKLKERDFLKKTLEFKELLLQGKDILPQAFALVREASFRVNNERPFDVQMMGGIVLHEGKIAEQKTGEGKTLTAAMPLYLNALSGKGVHLVTVNDYLARVGVGWMGPIYHLMGLTTSAIIHDTSYIFDPQFEDINAADWRLRHLRPVTRKEAYQADITYGINSEFGFDYLRDNMAKNFNEVVQRDFNFAIVDEVDSVLIDEARTPHIISAPQDEPTQKYYEYAQMVKKLTGKLDYVIDEKMRTVHLTDHGIAKIESLLGVQNVYETEFKTVHHIEAALKALALYQKDKDYVIRDGEVVIVDEFTGRLKPGNRWSEGIHQAVEAKEGVAIKQESKTQATISLQNYFRKYKKIAGMTGTAQTEAEEFNRIYKLDVVVIPTNKPQLRKDLTDQVYKNQRAKYAAIVADVEDCYKRGQPVLVGTTSIEKNEIISQFLKHKNIPFQILNAKQHEKEAQIISQAGKKKAVTVATNMAGRGVDILLGGAPPKHDDGRPMLNTLEWKNWEKEHQEVIDLGGLHVIGTERHDSRRIDNQLRGRAGRQGDPGSSRFYLALDDDLMRIFGGDQVAKMMGMFNIPENQPLEHPLVNRSIEQAQKKVEGLNFDARKHVVEYDDVMNQQREIIYDRRREILNPKFSDISKLEMLEKIDSVIKNIVLTNQDDPEKMVADFSTIIPFDADSQKRILGQNPNEEMLTKIAHDTYEAREKMLTVEIVRELERWVPLTVIDELWVEHLDTIDDLRQGIGLRGYAQRDPLVEYKSEAFNMFERLIAAIDDEIVHRIFKIQVNVPNQQKVSVPTPKMEVPDKKKLGRNDPCYCGSGKKYKHCHWPN